MWARPDMGCKVSDEGDAEMIEAISVSGRLWNPENLLAVVQLFAVAVTAWATIRLWRATRVLADETKTLAKMTSQPFVVGSLEAVPGISAHNVLNFVLRNTGNATAFDVRTKISPALPRVTNASQSCDSETLFEVSLLPPGQALPLQGVVLEKIRDESFNLSVSWSPRPGAEPSEHIKYSIHGKDLPNEDWNVKGTHNIAEEIMKVREILKNK